VAQDDKEQDRALLAYLRGCESANATGEVDAAADTPVPGDEVDQFLRAMGYNRIEREEMRRRRPQRTSEDRYRATTLKRFAYYIRRWLPDLTPDRAAELANEWASVTSYDVDLAQRWWNSGVSPNDPSDLAHAIMGGLQIQDLAEVVNGKTIAEHLQAGSSPTWCLRALHWQRSA
jgi:hypothetical protein